MRANSSRSSATSTKRPKTSVGVVDPEEVLEHQAPPQLIDINEVKSCVDPTAALNLAQRSSRLSDETISSVLKISQSHLSRIMSGALWFPNDEKYLNFLNLTNNDIPTIWAAEHRQFDWSTIRKHGTAMEKEIERLNGVIAQKDTAILEIFAAFTKNGHLIPEMFSALLSKSQQ